jgi:membrane protein involved in colicin uptake
MQLVWAERSYPITGGILASLVFHVLLALLIVFGVPSFLAPEVLEAPPTIELATLADITAAPTVDKAGKPMDKPKPQPPAPETKKETKPEPPKPAPPTPATPPPPAPEQQAAVIPDKPIEKAPDEKKPEPKPEEKKKEEKKKADEKPKPDKKQNQDMDSLLKSLSQDTPAPDTNQKPKKTPPAPAEATTGQVTDLVNDVPLTMAETDGIRSAIEKNWLIPLGMANAENYTVSLRLHLTPDGVVTQIDVLDDIADPGFRTIAESARRAILITQSELGRLPIPADKYNPTIVVRWPMKLICEQRGGC